MFVKMLAADFVIQFSRVLNLHQSDGYSYMLISYKRVSCNTEYL